MYQCSDGNYKQKKSKKEMEKTDSPNCLQHIWLSGKLFQVLISDKDTEDKKMEEVQVK